jgi:hypothetical protein
VGQLLWFLHEGCAFVVQRGNGNASRFPWEKDGTGIVIAREPIVPSELAQVRDEPESFMDWS